MPLSQQQAVSDLTVMLEKHPRKGGPKPDGLNLLQANNADFERVAKVVLGIEIDGGPCNERSMLLAEEACLAFGWNLNFDQQTHLAAYLLTCLIRLGYYKPRYLARVGYVLDVRKKELLDFQPHDPCTQHERFPPWTGPRDESQRRLVKPSHPQLEETVWEADPSAFENHWLQEKVNTYGLDDKGSRYRTPKTMRPSALVWVQAANALEDVGYKINKKMLELVNRVADDKEKVPPRKIPSVERQFKNICNKFEEVHPKEGIWKKLTRKEHRTIQYLHQLRKQGQKVHNDELEYISVDQLRAVKDHWSRFFPISNYRKEIASAHREFKVVVARANELADKPFYHRCFLDYRGRLYLSKSIVNYQKGDLCRGLIEFANGKPIPQSAMRYLWVHLANTYGAKGDPRTLEDTGKKLKTKALRYAKNPFGTYKEWSKVDGDKWMFIRACIEVNERLKNPKHISHLICEIDQSQSALQHISLIVGDRQFSHRCNMGDEFHDTYAEIATNVVELNDCPKGLKRTLVKEALVPWTYGGAEWTAFKNYCVRQHSTEYLKDKTPVQLYAIARGVLSECRRYLQPFEQYKIDVQAWAGRLWDEDLKEQKRYYDAKNRLEPDAALFRAGSGSTEDRAEWLLLEEQKVSNPPAKQYKQRRVAWTTPTGFVVWYYCQETEPVRRWYSLYADDDPRPKTGDIRTRLTLQKPLPSTTDNERREALKAVAPNYVHSMDGAVAQMVLAIAGVEEIDVVTVHDAFGTHLYDTEAVAKTFRECLTSVYRTWKPPFIDDENFRYLADSDLEQFLLDVNKSPQVIN